MVGLKITWLLTTCLSLLAQVHAYGSGAPEGACESLTPSHNVQAQTSPSPYKVTPVKTTLKAGEQLEFTISGPSSFKGFAVRVQQAGGFTEGTFTPNSYSSLRCSGQGLTHANPSPKNNIKFTWTPSSSLAASTIQIVATIVQEKEIFWRQVLSQDITVEGGADASGGNQAGTDVSQPPFVSGGSGSQPTSANTSKNGGVGTQNPGSISVDSACGVSKGCYHDCQSGSPCTYIISWTYEQEEVNFQFLYKTTSKSDQWIALGLSHDTKMGDDSVLECVMEQGKVLIKTSFNNGKFNEYPDDKTAGISDSSGSVKDGILACSFRRKIDYSPEPRVFSLRQTYHVMVATGEAVSGNKFPHSYESLPKVSAQKISFQDVGNIEQGLEAAYPLVKSHGAIMIFAWLLFASWGLFTARHGKSMFHNAKPLGIHIWFHIHRPSMAITAGLTVIGLILMLIESKGYSSIPDVPGKGYRFIHPPLGLVLVIITLVNPLMAIFRPDPKSPSRKFFNWSHLGIGLSAWIISLVLILIGLDLSKSRADVEAIYVVFAFIVYQLLIELLIRLVPFIVARLNGNFKSGTKQNKNSYDISMNGPPANETPRAPENDGTADKSENNNEKIQQRTNIITSAIIIFHLPGSLCFVIAVLYFLLRRA